MTPWARFRDDLLGTPLRRAFGEPCMVGEAEGGAGGAQPGAGAAGAAAGAGGAAGGQVPPVDPAGEGKEVPAWVKEIRTEAATRRVELKKAQDTIGQLQQKITELEAAGKKEPASPEGTPKPGTPEAEVAALKKQLADQLARTEKLEKAGSQASEAARKKVLTTHMKGLATGLKLNAQDSAVTLLESQAKVKDDDSIVFVVKDETGEVSEVPATADALAKFKLLDPVFFPSSGVAGTGSRAEVTAPAGLDLTRISDPAYYRQHHEAIKKWQREREQGR
jgi:hypothetical protein